MSKLEKLLLLSNLIIYLILAIFSYSYVDLNLTLSQNPQVLWFVKSMQSLGYFNRPLATGIYVTLISTSFIFFAINLWLFLKSKVTRTYLKLATLLNTFILIFAYPFLSSDLFNYLFDAKMILKYHANPYTHRPIDFPNDEWLRFMRWIHRYSPYGPLWLVMSLIPAFLGFGKFILNFITFKIFIGLFHLINTYLISKTLNKINPKTVLFGTAFYALNPLFLIEGIANAHNDIVLATFLLVSIYFVVSNKFTSSYFSLFLGTLIKYIPILNLPWLIWASAKGKSKNLQTLIWLNLATMAIFTYLFSSFRITVPFVSTGATQVQFQSWYLFWTLPFVSLLPIGWLVVVAMSLSFSALLRYLPYLYWGDWSQPGTINFMQTAIILPLIIAGIIVLVKRFYTEEKIG